MSTQGPFLPCPFVSPLCDFATEAIDICLAGESAAMRRVRSQLQRIAPYVRTALITGETGTGKEQVARALHARGPGADGPFVVWQAAAFAERLTGAERGGTGQGGTGTGGSALLQAHGGTLFLAKIDGVTPPHQAALLRLLQQQAMRTQRCDVRIVASSDQELRTLMTMGQFREDLYRRVAAVEIGLVPLRRRQEDIAGVVEALLGGRGIAAEALARLERYGWPGNVRELQEVVEGAAAMAGDGVIEVQHLLLPEAEEESEQGLERLQDVVRRHVLEVLTRCSGNKLRASEVLGISRSTLYRMLDADGAGVDPGYSG